MPVDSAQVVVAEGAPRHGGQELARRLAGAGMHTTLIPDSAIFAMMARVNKVAPQHRPSDPAAQVPCLSVPGLLGSCKSLPSPWLPVIVWAGTVACEACQ